METKKCTKCQIEKILDNFYDFKGTKDGKSWLCKTCQNANSKKYNSDKMEIKKEYERKFKKERQDYIYETNPSNYEDYENNTKDYPWGYPFHLQDFTYFLLHNNEESLVTFKRNKNDFKDKINYYYSLFPKKEEEEQTESTFKCTKCEIDKSIKDFGINKKTKLGHNSICKACVNNKTLLSKNLKLKKDES